MTRRLKRIAPLQAGKCSPSAFILGGLAAAIYNLAVKRVGGIEVEVE